MKKRMVREGLKKIIIMIFLVLLLAIMYIIVNNMSSIREAFLAIPLDWAICIVIGIIVKTIADFIAKSSRKRKRKKSDTSTEQ